MAGQLGKSRHRWSQNQRPMRMAGSAFEDGRPSSKPEMSDEKKTIILGVAESDAHVVANRLIAILLKENGYKVINLGACTPVQEFMDAYQRNLDAIAIVIGSLNGHAARDLATLATNKCAYQVRCPIILGGNLSVGADKNGNDGARLLTLGIDRIVADPETLVTVLDELVRARVENAA